MSVDTKNTEMTTINNDNIADCGNSSLDSDFEQIPMDATYIDELGRDMIHVMERVKKLEDVLAELSNKIDAVHVKLDVVEKKTTDLATQTETVATVATNAETRQLTRKQTPEQQLLIETLGINLKCSSKICGAK